MSNSLKDHMAEVLLRAILARPDKCPPEVLMRANNHLDVWDMCMKEKTHAEQVRRGRFDSETWIRLKRALTDHADSLPAILADYEP